MRAMLILAAILLTAAPSAAIAMLILAAILLTAAPAAAIELLCPEEALDVTASVDPLDLTTCTQTPILDLLRTAPDPSR